MFFTVIEKKKDNLIYSISINLLIDKKEDAKRQLENLTEYEKEEYLKYPISIFLRWIEKVTSKRKSKFQM